MTPWKRAVFGGMLGALLVLLSHSLTRPYYSGSLWQIGDSKYLQTTGLLPQNLSEISQPNSLADASYWISVAMELDQSKPGLRSKDIRALIELAQRCESLQPDNAYWSQTLSVLYRKSGEKLKALDRWQSAATKLTWDDLQNSRLQNILEGLRRESDANLAWHYAFAYQARSTILARQIYAFGRDLASNVSLETPEGLRLRYATLANGRLLRDGARSIAGGEFGFELIEAASFPQQLRRIPSQKRLLIARGALVNELIASGMTREATMSREAFDSNEAWAALVQSPEAHSEPMDLAKVSILSGTLPGSLILIAAFGAALGLFGRAIERSPSLQWFFRTPVAPVMGILMAIWVYSTTHLSLPAMWVVLTLSFFAFEPSHPRASEPDDMGPFFRFVIVTLGFALLLVSVAFVTGLTAAGIRLAGLAGIPPEYADGSTLILGLGGIVLGMVLVTAPAWGLVQRYSPQRLAGLALRECGIGLCVASLALGILAGPSMMAIDRDAQDTLRKLAFNEPTYYLIR